MSKSKQRLALLFLCVIAMTCIFRPTLAEASAGNVTAYEKVTWGISTGRYYVNGIHAFCAEYSKTWPTVGTRIVSIVPCENEVIKKALYYGYNGPANSLGTDARAHVLTAIAISDANIGERATGASAKYDTFYWDIVNNPSKYPSPSSNFKAYLAIPSSEKMQTLAFYEMEKNGYVKGTKCSSNPILTNENNCYSLEGAEYGIYSDASVDEHYRIGTIVTDAEGNTNVLELTAGTYYACEVKAPKGYAKDKNVISFTITPEQTTILQFTDDPQVNPVSLLLQKVDAETGLNKPQGAATLKGAWFTAKYYKGLWENDVDPISFGVSPERTWIFETDENGAVYMEDEYLISGDALYKELPLGTITIQETKASQGYLLNETVFVRQITAEGDNRNVATYQYPMVREEKIPPYVLIINKTDVYKNLLEGAEFTLYTDEACRKEMAKGITGSDGTLHFQNLEVGEKYYLKETKAPAGYKISQEDEKNVYEIYSLSSPEKNEYHLNVTNEADIVLPNTGSHFVLLMPMAGVALCSISIYLTTKSKKGEKHMKKFNLFLGALLSITILFGATAPVHAASTKVNIEVKETTMDNVSVTVPSTLPILFNEDGTNTFPTNWNIENKSIIAGIHLSQIDMNAGESGWKLLSESQNTKTMAADAKSIQFSVGKEGALKLVAPISGGKSVSESPTGTVKFEVDEIAIASGTSQTLSFAVNRGAFTTSQAASKAFDMVLTFNFN